jgi:hypothetical protein
MTTEHDLDARLQAARGLREEDLPALSAAFLDYLHASTDTHRPDADSVRAHPPVPAETPASVLAARQLVADAHQRRGGAALRGRRRPSRKAILRVGAGVLVLAAAWTTAVVITAPGGERPPTASPEPTPSQAQPRTVGPVDPPGGLTLVAAEAITFPYALDPAPKRLTPEFVQSGGLSVPPFGSEPVRWGARYRSADDPGFTFSISTADPRDAPAGQRPQDMHADDHLVESGTVPVGDAEADFVRWDLESPDCDYVPSTPTQTAEPDRVCSDTLTELFWQRADGQCVYLWGGGDTYSQVAELAAVGASMVDRPQPVPLQVGLSPAGWSVSSYESTSNLALISDTDPSISNRISVSVQERWRGYASPHDLMKGMAEGNPVEQVTVKGRLAELASVPDHFAENRRMWNLAAQLPDGAIFLLQAPDTLSREDVLAIAEQVTYTP